MTSESWELLVHIDIPASQITISPDGEFLVATGVEVIDTLSSGRTNPTGAFIIEADTLEVVAEIDYPGEWHPDETGQILDQVAGSERLTVFGKAAMLSTPIRP
jgi:hypothetical protein